MKYREDFVTNSSSSSYIIAYKELFPDVDDETMQKYPWIEFYKELIRSVFDGDDSCESKPAEYFYSQEEFDEWVVDNYGGFGDYTTVKAVLEDDDYLQEIYKAVSKKISEGYSIMEKQVGYSDYTTEKFIEKLEDGKNFIVISDGE